MLALDAGRLEEFSSEAVGAVGARDTGRPAPISEPARVPFAVTKRAGCRHSHGCLSSQRRTPGAWVHSITPNGVAFGRSEEHTSELQSRENLVCRLLLEKKKNSFDFSCWTVLKSD